MIEKFNWHYFYIFMQSNLLEVPLYYLVLRRFTPGLAIRSLFESDRILYFICAVTVMNSVTHPVVFFGIMNLDLTYLQNIIAAEAFAVVSETLFFLWLLEISTGRAFAAALIANLVSWQLAPVLTYYLTGIFRASI